MENENKYYVYLHIREDNGQPFYVGKGCRNRLKQKTKRTKYWHNVVNKYGYDIILLEENLTNEIACEKEIYWIKRIGRKDLGNGPLINFTDGGDGSIGYKHTEESKEKIRQATLGRIVSKETKEKIGQASLGRKHSDETKKKIGKSGKNNANAKAIIDIKNNIIYDTLNEAAFANNISRQLLTYKIKKGIDFNYCK